MTKVVTRQTQEEIATLLRDGPMRLAEIAERLGKAKGHCHWAMNHLVRADRAVRLGFSWCGLPGQSIPKVECACGCGTMIDVGGGGSRPRRMAKGHGLSSGNGSTHRGWKGGRIRIKGGYIGVWVPVGHHLRNKNGYAAEHRLVAEQKLGRRLRKPEIVHHLNGDPSDNRPENLQVVSGMGQHNRSHPGQIKRWQRAGTTEAMRIRRLRDPTLGRKRRTYLKRFVGRSHHLADRNGSASVHRIEAEAKLGRRLEKTEVVHHINGDTWDNRPDNLLVFPDHSAHLLFHFGKVAQGLPADVKAEARRQLEVRDAE